MDMFALQMGVLSPLGLKNRDALRALRLATCAPPWHACLYRRSGRQVSHHPNRRPRFEMGGGVLRGHRSRVRMHGARPMARSTMEQSAHQRGGA
jgi:hypothetical protein